MRMKMQNDGRIRWLDYANVLAMAAVVWFHIPSDLELPIYNYEYYAVNITFFFLSGFTFSVGQREKLDFVPLLKKIGRTLGLPTIVFYFTFYVLWLLVGRRVLSESLDWYVPLVEFLKLDFTHVLASYWFVVCLMFIYLLYYLLDRLVTRKWIVALVCGLMPLTILGHSASPCLCKVFLFIPFFAIGTFLNRCRATNEHYVGVGFVCLGLIVYFVVAYLWGECVYYTVDQLIVAALLCALICWLGRIFSCLVELDRPVLFLRNSALVLLATQNYIIGCLKVLLGKVFAEGDYLAQHFAVKPIIWLVVYLITIPIALWLRSRRFIISK